MFICMLTFHFCWKKPETETYNIPHGPYSVVNVNNREANQYDRQVGEVIMIRPLTIIKLGLARSARLCIKVCLSIIWIIGISMILN